MADLLISKLMGIWVEVKEQTKKEEGEERFGKIQATAQSSKKVWRL